MTNPEKLTSVELQTWTLLIAAEVCQPHPERHTHSLEFHHLRSEWLMSLTGSYVNDWWAWLSPKDSVWQFAFFLDDSTLWTLSVCFHFSVKCDGFYWGLLKDFDQGVNVELMINGSVWNEFRLLNLLSAIFSQMSLIVCSRGDWEKQQTYRMWWTQNTF